MFYRKKYRLVLFHFYYTKTSKTIKNSTHLFQNGIWLFISDVSNLLQYFPTCSIHCVPVYICLKESYLYCLQGLNPVVEEVSRILYIHSE